MMQLFAIRNIENGLWMQPKRMWYKGVWGTTMRVFNRIGHARNSITQMQLKDVEIVSLMPVITGVYEP